MSENKLSKFVTKKNKIIAMVMLTVLGVSLIGYDQYTKYLVRVENEAIMAAGFDLAEKDSYDQAIAAGFQKKAVFLAAKKDGIATAQEYDAALKDAKDRGFDSISSTKKAKAIGFENSKDVINANKLHVANHDALVVALEAMKARGIDSIDDYAVLIDKEAADAKATAELALLSDVNDLFSKFQKEGAIACKEPVEKLSKNGFEWQSQEPTDQFAAYKPEVVSSGVLTLVGDQISFGKKTTPVKKVSYSCNYDVVNKVVVTAVLEKPKK